MGRPQRLRWHCPACKLAPLPADDLGKGVGAEGGGGGKEPN